MLGKTEGKRKRGWQRIRWLERFMSNSMDKNLRKLREIVEDRILACCSPGVAQSQTQLSN